MSGGGIKVGGGGLDTLISDMVKGVGDLRGILSDMDGKLKPHMAEWEGGAQGAYKVAQDRWNTEINDLNELLLDIKKAVEESKENYLAGELRNKQSWE